MRRTRPVTGESGAHFSISRPRWDPSFVVGRKGWLFSDVVAGVNASANLYSLLETAKASGHAPFFYLRHVLTELPKAQTAYRV